MDEVIETLRAALDDEIARSGLDFTGEPAIAAAHRLGLAPLGAGRHRLVFRLGEWVIKIPVGERAEDCP